MNVLDGAQAAPAALPLASTIRRELHHGVLSLFAESPDGSAALARVEPVPGGTSLATLARVRIDEGEGARTITPLSAPISFPLAKTVDHIRAAILALEAALGELEPPVPNGRLEVV
jgi:hypothetical protein